VLTERLKLTKASQCVKHIAVGIWSEALYLSLLKADISCANGADISCASDSLKRCTLTPLNACLNMSLY